MLAHPRDNVPLALTLKAVKGKGKYAEDIRAGATVRSFSPEMLEIGVIKGWNGVGQDEHPRDPSLRFSR